MNYYDILLAKKLEDDRDPQVVGLSVTENGTYAEEGKVYKPVVVNVPLGSKSITANGVYNAASDNLKGFSSVDVNVEGYKITDVSGLPSAIATFTDGSALPMPKLKVAVEPQQDLHGYDTPWVGGAGKNKFPIKVNLSTQAYYNQLPLNTDLLNYLQNNKGKTVTWSVKKTGTNMSGGYEIGTLALLQNGAIKSTFIVNSPFVISSSVDFTTIDAIAIYGGTGLATITDCQLEEGSTATSYAPYENECPIIGWSAVDVTVADDVDNPTTTETITIQLGDTYYGGKLDVVSGVLTVDMMGITLDGTETNIYKNSTVPSVYGISMEPYNIPWVDDGNFTYAQRSKISHFKGMPYVTGAENLVDGTIDSYSGGFGGSGVTGVWFRFKASQFADFTIEQMKAKLAEYYNNGKPLRFVVPITPQTIQLTPTAVSSLLGSNNLWADTGDVLEASYWEEL